ncbi:SWIM zinc finger family protein [Chromatium okenii]|nr:SWIM zinc finger family protein [Chromatium okenii]
MFDCTCPHADDGNFCKHCVAVGLTWLTGMTNFNKTEVETDEKPPADSLAENPRLSRSTSAETLIKLLLDAAQYDERIYRSLY